MNIYIISDTHLHHDNIIIYCNRPTNHTELILENWCNIVKEDDLIIHLGDVIFKRASELDNILHSLPGKKILVRGNHDRETLEWYMTHGFDFACDSFIFEDILFTHIPSAFLPANTKINIHGHLHNAPFIKEKWNLKSRPFNRLFALENEEYKPVLLETFLNKYDKANW